MPLWWLLTSVPLPKQHLILGIGYTGKSRAEYPDPPMPMDGPRGRNGVSLELAGSDGSVEWLGKVPTALWVDLHSTQDGLCHAWSPASDHPAAYVLPGLHQGS